MNSVIGLDIAKGESKGQVFLDKGKPYGNSFNISHTREGLDQLHELLRSVGALSDSPPTVIFESTGHYHTPITQFLDEHS